MTKSAVDKEYGEAQLASFWGFKFKESMVAKAPFTKRWQSYIDAYHGDYFKGKNLPDYKSDLVTNYIFSTIETIRPIMLDNDPKFQALPRTPDGTDFANDLQKIFEYEWDRTGMNSKLYQELITSLSIGTAIIFLSWDKEEKQITPISVNPFNLFPDPLATCVEDAEYLIYPSYKNETVLKRMYPEKAHKLIGGGVQYGELVHGNDADAKVDNQILVLEVWTRDYETLEKDDKDVLKQKYPNGRVITICPELGVVLADKPNPFQDGGFPFFLMKDYDVPGKFWGEGEVAQLLSPQKYMNELSNTILDNAKATANMPWIVDKNAGVAYGKITNRPGLVIRKNPGTDLRREQPPSMPSYVQNAIDSYKGDIEQISGVFNSVKGTSETGVYTAQGILALQEAGQARIRLKVKLMEDFLSKLATAWFYRMKQFWNEERWIRIANPDGTYEIKEFTMKTFEHDFDVKIMAGSTMQVNRGAMLDLMIRLAQTQMPDGQALVDREAVTEYLPNEVRTAIMGRMQQSATAMEQQLQETHQMIEQLGQQLQEVAEESTSNDEDVFGVIEQMTGAVEKINKQILQLEQKYARMEEEKKKEEERNQIRTQSYNEGYKDAERILTSDTMEEGDPLEQGMFDEELEALLGGMGEEGEPSITEDLGEGELLDLPDDLLQGLEELSDDELAVLLEQYPQLADLLR